ncbi:related to RNA-binding protein (RRM superfamily) [Ustilago bromivora]|uniref:Related to RNA-binding protein (RRM superfamily) n=1 Tax=Ustilago bromivora TaxID=307758 RepID=A0A1K0G3B1_9BASI|nr:related to RNA-binding protein (RRM superfamily) [Ustilago bromivora]SYW75401.1 related to RNA-binding protein (RRM superfamily) [Ustilago bromivora]
MASHSSVGAARQHSRILFVKNLNYNTTGADLYQVFSRYGAIRQIRLGDGPKTKGTAYVVYEEMADSKRASDHLNGFHLNERYIVLLFHMPARLAAKADLARREAELAELKALHYITDDA